MKRFSLPLLVTVLALCVDAAAAEPLAPAPAENVWRTGERPIEHTKGGYASINRSIAAGQTSFTRQQIISYGLPRLEKFQGHTYWCIPVKYTATAHAPASYAGKPLSRGIYVVEARALLQSNTVKHWLYQHPGSEPSAVPVR